MAGYMMRRNQTPERRHLSDRAGNYDVEGPPDAEPFPPPTIDGERICKRCFVLDSCMHYVKAVENVVDATSPIADTFDLKTSHPTATHTLFKKWEPLFALGEQDLVRFKREL